MKSLFIIVAVALAICLGLSAADVSRAAPAESSAIDTDGPTDAGWASDAESSVGDYDAEEDDDDDDIEEEYVDKVYAQQLIEEAVQTIALPEEVSQLEEEVRKFAPAQYKDLPLGEIVLDEEARAVFRQQFVAAALAREPKIVDICRSFSDQVQKAASEASSTVYEDTWLFWAQHLGNHKFYEFFPLSNKYLSLAETCDIVTYVQ